LILFYSLWASGQDDSRHDNCGQDNSVPDNSIGNILEAAYIYIYIITVGWTTVTVGSGTMGRMATGWISAESIINSRITVLAGRINYIDYPYIQTTSA